MIRVFRETLTSGYRMRRRAGAGRLRAARYSWLDAWYFAGLYRWAQRREPEDRR